LGQGDEVSRELPKLVKGLMKEKVDQVECGFKHVICRTSLKKVFTWGWGKSG